MTTSGIFFRRSIKSELILNPPIEGEMVFALDTGEHGWLDENGTLQWKRLIDDIVNSSGIIYETCAKLHISVDSTNWGTL